MKKQIYPQSISEQIESSLGEAYATGIRELAKPQLNSFL
jgi:hypothetical protein